MGDPDPEQTPPKRYGRPPAHAVAPTELGRWLRRRHMRSSDFVELARARAPLVGCDPEIVPTARSLTDICAGRYAPSAPVMLVIRAATDGEIDLEHWVRDLFHDRTPIGS